MNEPAFQSSSDVAEQVGALQRQVFVLLLVLLIVSITLAGYLCYVDHISHKDAATTFRPQAAQISAIFNANTVGLNKQAVPTVISQLAAYGATHPDFAQQVLKKYNIAPVASSPSVKK